MTTLDQLLIQAAEQFAERPALLHKPKYRVESWTYRELADQAAQVAGWLQAQGVQKGERVTLLGPNSPYWVIAFFAAVKLGAIVVPLDANSEPEFIARVLAKTEPRLALIAQSSSWEWSTPAWPLEDLASLSAGCAAPQLEPIGAEDVAEVVFTSGSTGDPKGVMLTHANITSNVSGVSHVVPHSRDFRLLSILPLSHMLEQTIGLLLPLTCGASIYYSASRQSMVIFRCLRDWHITTMLLVPQALELFMDAIEREVAQRGKMDTWRRLGQLARRLPLPARRLVFAGVLRRLGGTLEFFMSGGAPLAPELVAKWETLGIPILHGYGATEASPVISIASHEQRNPRAVGKLVDGVRLKVAADGELLAQGPNITPGYWRDPSATDAAFCDGWYKTGDLGQLDADGYLYLRGRKRDRIVLADGQNVYAEDVEAVLRQDAAVTDVAVVGLPGAHGVSVHAALLCNPALASDPAAIVRRANSKLAARQRIAGFTLWPDADFPRTPTLKIKKHEVLKRLLDRQTGAMAHEIDAEPAAGSEDRLLKLISEISAIPVANLASDSTLSDNLGLDSLAQVELLAAIETELGGAIAEDQLSATTTIADLRAMLAANQPAPEPQFAAWPLSPLARAGRAILQPLVFSALRLFAPTKIQGRRNLQDLDGPALFVANHSSHLDSPTLLAALPPRIRRRIAVAAAADYFFAGRRVWLQQALALLFNAFPFSRAGAVRPTLEHCAGLVEHGWSILLFPEGTRGTGESVATFKTGVGLLAVELGVPVVPVFMDGLATILPKGAIMPRRGNVRLVFGRPLRFCQHTTPEGAAAQIEQAVRDLAATIK